jgi:preprotein translocase subunit SecF
MKHKKLYFAISLAILIPGIYSLVRYGLKPSIDFTGGTLLEIQTAKSLSSEEIINLGKAQNIEISSVQPSGENAYILRAKSIDKDQNTKFQTQVASVSGGIKELQYESVGPVVGKELTQKAILAVVIASLAIIAYIAWSFRHVPKPYTSWKFGVSAVLALIHDAVVVLGVFSILGHLRGVEVDSLFVTAVLTVIGFSVHDTIVVFDRVRENLPKMPKESFSDVVDFSLAETLVRSLNTSLTVVLTLVALLLFGGESVRWFVAALLVGIISGTYSSIFNAAPLLVLWETRRK